MLSNHPIETTRLKLSELALSDSSFILELLNTPGWLAFIGDRKIANTGDAEAYINKITLNTNTTYWVVRPKEGNIPVGIVTLIQREYLDHPDIGFAFLPGHAKKGYAHEAAGAVLQEVVKSGSYPEILATTVKENHQSISLLEKLGLNFKQEIVIENETLLLYSITADKYRIDRLTHKFFRIFSNTNGQEPPLDTISELCLAKALIIKKAGLTEEVYNLESFIAPRKKILNDGTLTEFEEKEISGQTIVSGTIAQRSSVFRKQGILNHKAFEQKGHKFFQFIKTIEGWRISSVIWQDEEH
jgi:RimJ/RimL family protein N-acetyltransferase